MTNEELLAKIKAEIERLKSIEYPCDNSQQATGFFNAIDRMTDFLDTLESEKPTNPEGLEEEISKSIENLEGCTTKVGGTPEYHLINDEGLREFARHFAKWGAEHLASVGKTSSDDLEEAAEKSLRLAGFHNMETRGMDWKGGFIAGYKYRADHTPLPEDTVLFNKGVEEGKRLMKEDYPKWHKVQRGSCFDKHTNFILSAREGHFYCSSMEVPRDGYILLVDELERLPKEDEK